MNRQSASGFRYALAIRWSLILLVLAMMASGCSSIGGYLPSGRLPYRDLSTLYHKTPLRQSSSLDILRRMKAAQGSVDAKHVEREAITQSDTVIASSGRSRKGTKSWFTLFTFDKYSNIGERKCFFYLDEKASRHPIRTSRYLVPARSVLIFDAQAHIGDVLSSPYASEPERMIAIIRFLAQQLQQDIQLLGVEDTQMRDADIVGVHGLFMNQVFRDILVEVKKFPVLTRQLQDPKGVTFKSLSLGGGTIKLKVDADLATVRIEMGLSD